MNKERLLKLADYMEKVNSESYNQSTWASNLSSEFATFETFKRHRYKDRYDDGYKIIVKEDACGSTMCVLGHAVNALPEIGMFFYVDSACELPGGVLIANRACILRIDGDNIEEGTFLASKVFDIQYGDALVLFGDTHSRGTFNFYTGKQPRSDEDDVDEDYNYDFKDVTPKVVAEKIREYVNTDGASIRDALQHNEFDGF